MIKKIKDLGWETYSTFLVIFAHIATIFFIIHLTQNTKRLENKTLFISYALIGLISLFLIKVNHDKPKDLQE